MYKTNSPQKSRTDSQAWSRSTLRH